MGALFSSPKTPKAPDLPPPLPEPPKVTDTGILQARTDARRRAAGAQFRPVLSGELAEPATAKPQVLGY